MYTVTNFLLDIAKEKESKTSYGNKTSDIFYIVSQEWILALLSLFIYFLQHAV